MCLFISLYYSYIKNYHKIIESDITLWLVLLTIPILNYTQSPIIINLLVFLAGFLNLGLCSQLSIKKISKKEFFKRYRNFLLIFIKIIDDLIELLYLEL